MDQILSNKRHGSALISLDVSKRDIHKDHAVATGAIVGGIQTDVALQKNTLFGATKGNFSFLFAIGIKNRRRKHDL
ncbi:MAG: hypothetical protein ACKOX6_05730 [Bdellovibrio sp.]